jgi:hypothetical protein
MALGNHDEKGSCADFAAALIKIMSEISTPISV